MASNTRNRKENVRRSAIVAYPLDTMPSLEKIVIHDTKDSGETDDDDELYVYDESESESESEEEEYDENDDDDEDRYEDVEEPKSDVTRQLPNVVTIPMLEEEKKSFYDGIIRDFSPDHRATILRILDDECANRGTHLMSLNSMLHIIWDPSVIHLMENDIDDEYKHPLMKNRGPDKGQPILVDVNIPVATNAPIVKRLGELIHFARRKNELMDIEPKIWVSDVELTLLRLNYTHAIAIRTVNPTSAWSVWNPDLREDKHTSSYSSASSLPYPSQQQTNAKKKRRDGGTDFYNFTRLNTHILSCPRYDPGIHIKRHHLWSLFVAGIDINTMVKAITGNDKLVLLKRNLATVIIIETLRSMNIPEPLKKSLYDCGINTDMKYFKISREALDEIKKIIEDEVKTTRLEDLQFEFMRFDEKNWFKSNHTSSIGESTGKLKIEFSPFIMYRDILPNEGMSTAKK